MTREKAKDIAWILILATLWGIFFVNQWGRATSAIETHVHGDAPPRR